MGLKNFAVTVFRNTHLSSKRTEKQPKREGSKKKMKVKFATSGSPPGRERPTHLTRPCFYLERSGKRKKTKVNPFVSESEKGKPVGGKTTETHQRSVQQETLNKQASRRGKNPSLVNLGGVVPPKNAE